MSASACFDRYVFPISFSLRPCASARVFHVSTLASVLLAVAFYYKREEMNDKQKSSFWTRILQHPLYSAIIAGVVVLIIGGIAHWISSGSFSGGGANGTPTMNSSRETPTGSVSSSSPQQSDSPTRSPSHQVEAPTTQALAQNPASPTPTATPPGPKSISGTYTFTRQVITCTFSSCGTTPIVVTLSCPSAGSCTAYWAYWGTHAATFDGSTIDVSFTGTGSINCKGTALPTAVTLDINVLSWTAGRGGAVRTPTRMQGTYTESAPASDLGCKAAGTQQTVSYG